MRGDAPQQTILDMPKMDDHSIREHFDGSSRSVVSAVVDGAECALALLCPVADLCTHDSVPLSPPNAPGQARNFQSVGNDRRLFRAKYSEQRVKGSLRLKMTLIDFYSVREPRLVCNASDRGVD